MTKADRDVLAWVRDGLRAAGDPERARHQQAYMKSTMPYAGVTMPVVRKLTRAAPPLEGWDGWHDTIAALWRQATVREERYAALELMDARAYRDHATSLPALALYEEVIVDGAWWDFVDGVAAHRLGALLVAHRLEMDPLMRTWSTDADRWRRRSSIICQLDLKEEVDTDLLTACIVANVDDRDFFLRKAIGWALRQHARVDPSWVRAFVGEHPLSPLSRREALRHLGGA